jgi:uncharacterized phage-associated protein
MTQHSGDERKLGELLLYVAKRLEDDPAGGATKVNKVLYFAEFAHVRAHGRPITGVEYQKLEHGPAPRRLVPLRRGLEEHGHAAVVDETYLGYVQKRLIAKRDADLSIFSPEERVIVDQVIDALHGRRARDVSELSHDEVGWQMVDVGETIPYEAAYLRQPVVTPAVRRHAAALAERMGRS